MSAEIEEEENNKRQRTAEPQDRKTIYILNLPENVSEREIRNFLIFFPGFQKVQLYDHNKNNNPAAQARGFVTMGAFALFESQSYALSAKDRIEGFMFDPFSTLPPLECRLAMKNMVMGRQEQQQMMTDGSKRGGGGYGHGGPPGGGPPHVPSYPYPPPAPQPYYQPPPQGYEYSPYGPPASGGYPYYPPNPPYPMPPPPAPTAYYPYPPPVGPPASSNSGSGTHSPGNTLFLSNLALVSEQELRSLAVEMDGYRDSKFMTDKRSQRVAFIAFHSIEHAEQGLRFFSTYKNLRVSFSKNPLGEYTNVDKRRAMGMGAAPDSDLV